MPIDKNNKTITIANIDKILSYLPVFEQKDYQFSIFHQSKLIEGRLHEPYYEYSEEVDGFMQALYDGGFIYPFDWPAWQDEASKYYSNPDMLKTADFSTVVKLLTVHIRMERFCEGCLNFSLKDGHINDILRRLKEIRQEMEKSGQSSVNIEIATL